MTDRFFFSFFIFFLFVSHRDHTLCRVHETNKANPNQSCHSGHSDIGQVPFHAAYVFGDVDDIYWAHEWLLNEVINIHAPVKERVSKMKRPAYINDDLRRAVFKKKMLFNKYKKYPSKTNWEGYRKTKECCQ